MTKIYMKLIAVVLALVISVSVAVMASYAWFVLSDSPTVSGIQVAIGGGNTILVAPDMTVEVNGVVCHYPGRFSDSLDFSQYDTYDYLQNLGGLMPVSTADGVNWFLPTYYSPTDKMVQLGQVPSGQLKDVSDFRLDDTLSYANLKPTEQEKLSEGSYIYLDFWVVSPGSEYTLRISTGEDSGGSFLIDLPQPVPTENGYTMGSSIASDELSATASARVGFLVSTERVTDESMQQYMASYGYDDRYGQLRGIYQETSEAKIYSNYSFCIYEPNADRHPGNPAMDGSYVRTSPVGLVSGQAAEVNVANLLTVQRAGTWADAAAGSGTALEQRFQAALLGMDWQNMTAAQISESFYGSYLQGQISPYMDKGSFVKRTSDLYSYSQIVMPEQLATVDMGGATEDVYIVKLERNVPQRIRMFIWLEGQDMDCVNGLSAASFALNIEFAGSNQDE